jgi:hypothetical protein
MVRGLLIWLAVATIASPAADPEPTVSLLLRKASAEQWDHDIHFRCEVALDNSTGRELAVRSNFSSVFDGLEVVVTTPEGKVIAQQRYSSHQSPCTQDGRIFPLKQGKTAGTLVFPIRSLPGDRRALKVRLVGTLPGSSFERILSSETIELEVKDRPGD